MRYTTHHSAAGSLAALLCGLLLAVLLSIRIGSEKTALAAAVAEDGPPSTQVTRAGWLQNSGLLPTPFQEAKIAASDAQSNDFFGTALAIDGDTAVVGAFSEDGGLGDPLWNAGAVYIFERNAGGPNNWAQVARLNADDPGFGDYFGNSVAISGDLVAVGAPYENGGPGNPILDAGAVYLFERNMGGPNNWGQIKKLTASDPQEEDDFGLDVTLDGDILVVGAPAEDGGPGDPMSYAGAAYVFERDMGGPNHWGQVKKLAASDAQTGDGFGISLTMDSQTLVVGAHMERGGPGDPLPWSGAAYVFERDHGGANNWGEVVKLAASDAQPNDFFGRESAIDSDMIVVSAPHESGGPGDPLMFAGAAYVFERNQGGPNNWGEVAKLTASDALENHAFGVSVNVRGETIIAGATGDNGGQGSPLPLAGAAYLFERDQGGPGNWGQIAKVSAGDADAGDFFGAAADINQDGVIVIGASDGDADGPPAIDNTGAVYIFCLDDGLEENDDFSSAAVVVPGDYPGLRVCSGDDDYYELSLDAGDTLGVDILFSHAAGNLDLELFDAGENLLAASHSQTDNESLVYDIAVTGSYYIRVFGDQGDHAGYELMVTVAPGGGSDTLFLPLLTAP